MKHANFLIILSILLSGLPKVTNAGNASVPIIVADKFTQYRDGSGADKTWDTGAADWEVHGSAFECMDGMRSFAIPIISPYARELTVEATISIHKPTGSQWKVAGIAVVLDNGNYWHLALVEQPNSMGDGHLSELSESLNGNWLAQSASGSSLKMTENQGGGFDWRYDHPYRFRLTASPQGIEGTISELDGTVRVRYAYLFNNPAVKTGRPALTDDSLVASFSDFKATIQEKAPAPPKPVYPPYIPLKPGLFHGKETGFFHVELHNGKWWIIDPSGSSFYAVGTDHVDYNAFFCEKLGYAPYHNNIEKQFGSEEKWAENSVQRLKAWHFNTLGVGCSSSTYYKGLPHTKFLGWGSGFTAVSDITPRTTWTGFPDVFHPRFAKWCDAMARQQCAIDRNDPWLLGYFIDNELEWFGKDGSDTGLVDETFKKPMGHPAKTALIKFLQGRYPSIADFNRAWGLNERNWAELEISTSPPASTTSLAMRDRTDFVKLIAERYFAITTEAIRKADPNHMVLGCRFAGFMPKGVMPIAGQYCDIVSVNYYGKVDMKHGYSPDMPSVMEKYYSQAKRPLMLTEWSFPALDAGLPSLYGAGQRVPTQKDKAFCYSVYQRTLFSLPFMVGSDYFMWVDEPAQGMSSTFSEDSNYGLVDVNDRPWKALTQMAERVNAMAQQIHSGDDASLSGEIYRKSDHRALLRIYNKGSLSATFMVRIEAGVSRMEKMITISANSHHDIPLRFKGSVFIRAVIDSNQQAIEAANRNLIVEKTILDSRLQKPCIVVINPTEINLKNVPVSIKMGKLGRDWNIRAFKGVRIPAQMDDLPNGPEISLLIPEIPPNGIITLPLVRGSGIASKYNETSDRSFSISGGLNLVHDSGSGSFFDRVLLGKTLLGGFKMIVHQTGLSNGWFSPDQIVKIKSFDGPVRKELIMTAVNNGKLPDSGAPYAITCRLDVYPSERWFGARFLQLQNIGTNPWRCMEYYIYPQSSIAGDTAADQPHPMDNVQLWFNPNAGLSYGALFDTEQFNGFFWKDTPQGVGEHPDIYRKVNLELQPGELLKAGSDNPVTYILGAKGTVLNPGGEVLERLKALERIKVMVY